MKGLMLNLLWPAVAGNVVWVFFSGLFEISSKEIDFAKIIALFFLSWYLCLDFVNTQEKQENLKDEFYKADLPLAFAIIFFAHSIHYKPNWSLWFLIAIFLIAGIGHWFGAWEEKTPPVGVEADDERVEKLIINGGGFIISLLFGVIFLLERKNVPEWYSPGAAAFTTGLVVICWSMHVIKKLRIRNRQQ